MVPGNIFVQESPSQHIVVSRIWNDKCKKQFSEWESLQINISVNQWWRDIFRCRIDLLTFSMGFNIIAPYMEFLHLIWCIAEWSGKVKMRGLSIFQFIFDIYDGSCSLIWWRNETTDYCLRVQIFSTPQYVFYTLLQKKFRIIFYSALSGTFFKEI